MIIIWLAFVGHVVYFCPTSIICALAPQIIYMPSKSHVIVPPGLSYSTLVAFNSRKEEEREPFLLPPSPPSMFFNPRLVRFAQKCVSCRSNEHLLLDCEQTLQGKLIFSPFKIGQTSEKPFWPKCLHLTNFVADRRNEKGALFFVSRRYTKWVMGNVGNG